MKECVLGLKQCSQNLGKIRENTCEGVHLLVKLLAISLQAYNFTKNELLQTYFSKILARFYLL